MLAEINLVAYPKNTLLYARWLTGAISNINPISELPSEQHTVFFENAPSNIRIYQPVSRKYITGNIKDDFEACLTITCYKGLLINNKLWLEIPDEHFYKLSGLILKGYEFGIYIDENITANKNKNIKSTKPALKLISNLISD